MIDDELIARVMRVHGLGTKREAVDFALRRAADEVPPEAFLSLRGIGWDGDLDEMRRARDVGLAAPDNSE